MTGSFERGFGLEMIGSLMRCFSVDRWGIGGIIL